MVVGELIYIYYSLAESHLMSPGKPLNTFMINFPQNINKTGLADRFLLQNFPHIMHTAFRTKSKWKSMADENLCDSRKY